MKTFTNLWTGILFVLLIPFVAYAEPIGSVGVNDLSNFSTGTTISSSVMNAHIDALEVAVDDNADDIDNLQLNAITTREPIDDWVDLLLTEGAGITLTYDDAANTLTINVQSSASNPTIGFDDSDYDDQNGDSSGDEARINANAAADNQGVIRLQVESGSDGTYVDALTVTGDGTGGATISGSSSLNLSSGTITGRVKTVQQGATATLTASDLLGHWYFVTGAYTITLPAVSSTGLSACFYSTAANVISIDTNANDQIVLNGTSLDPGDKINSSGAAGDFICLLNDSTDGWRSLGRSGTWIDAGP